MKRMILATIGAIIEMVDFQSTVAAWLEWEKTQTYPEPNLEIPIARFAFILIVCFVLGITGYNSWNDNRY